MIDVYLDFETYYDTEIRYSLRVLGIIEYVRDPRFHVHCAGLAVDDGPIEALSGEGLVSRLAEIPWHDARLVGHNLPFDGLILTEHYGHVPAKYLDTLALSRLHRPLGDKDLDSIAKWLGFEGKKGSIGFTDGHRVIEHDSQSFKELIEYVVQDISSTRRVCECLLTWSANIPEELDLVSLTTRCCTIATFRVDFALLELLRQRSKTEAEERMEQVRTLLGDPPDLGAVLRSNPKFFEVLASLYGEETVNRELIKISKTTGKPTPALAKNDPEVLRFLEENPDARPLFEARFAAKSRIQETRAARFIRLAKLGGGTLPMPLKYWGAHTGRWSGTDGLNVQNLPRGSDLRKALLAPPGHKVLVADSAQIELRVNAWFCGQTNVLDSLRQHQDVYRSMAASLFGVAPEDVTKNERQFGKVVVLGAGYGMGWKTFRRYCASGPMGMAPMWLTEEQARRTIETYRSQNPQIADMWERLSDIVAVMASPESCPGTMSGTASSFSPPREIEDTALEPVVLLHPVRIGRGWVDLPNHTVLWYPGLQVSAEDNDMPVYWYRTDRGMRRLYGGLLLENLIQALARIVIAHQTLLIDQLPGVRVVTMTHDEVVAVVPTELADESLSKAIEIMSTAPSWAPDLPLSAEGGVDDRYSK